MISDIPGIELKKTCQESLPIQFTFQISYFVASFPKLTPLLVTGLQTLFRKLSNLAKDFPQSLHFFIRLDTTYKQMY